MIGRGPRNSKIVIQRRCLTAVFVTLFSVGFSWNQIVKEKGENIDFYHEFGFKLPDKSFWFLLIHPLLLFSGKSLF